MLQESVHTLIKLTSHPILLADFTLGQNKQFFLINTMKLNER